LLRDAISLYREISEISLLIHYPLGGIDFALPSWYIVTTLERRGSMSKNRKAKDSINPNQIATRDPLMVRLICGATKTGTQQDRKKEARRRACRSKVRGDE
jgi:hypothetical protein